MEIWARPFLRGDQLEEVNEYIFAGIGACSKASLQGSVLEQPLEVVYLEGAARSGFFARLGDAQHKLFEGALSAATVSFTIESFATSESGAILPRFLQDEKTQKFDLNGSLQLFILQQAQQKGWEGGVLYLSGIASELHVYGHTDIHRLNEDTKTFDHPKGEVFVEGWGNLSFVDGKQPFVHMHGTYSGIGFRKGGHFMMDEYHSLVLKRGHLYVHPVSKITRTLQGEDFPTWKK